MFDCPASTNQIHTGAKYLFKGACLIWHPQLRPFILVPLLINAVLFVVLTGYVINQFEAITQLFADIIPGILKPLAWFVGFIVACLLVLVYGYSFNIITNIIAAPFYGLLAEKAEQLCCGESPPDEGLVQMIPRVIWREIRKLMYFFTRGILVTLLVILIGTLGPLGVFAPLIGLAWTAWTMSIQYADYAADNHQVGFKDLRQRLGKKAYSSFGFGGAVMGCTLIPLVNIVVMPAAVVGGTLFWVHELKHCRDAKLSIEQN